MDILILYVLLSIVNKYENKKIEGLLILCILLKIVSEGIYLVISKLIEYYNIF